MFVVFLDACYRAISLPDKILIEMFIDIIVDSHAVVRNNTEKN